MVATLSKYPYIDFNLSFSSLQSIHRMLNFEHIFGSSWPDTGVVRKAWRSHFQRQSHAEPLQTSVLGLWMDFSRLCSWLGSPSSFLSLSLRAINLIVPGNQSQHHQPWFFKRNPFQCPSMRTWQQSRSSKLFFPRPWRRSVGWDAVSPTFNPRPITTCMLWESWI